MGDILKFILETLDNTNKNEMEEINMLSTGIVRKVDGLGRIVIPKELRRTMGIDESDGLEIFTDDGKIILRRYITGCVFCGEMQNTIVIKNKTICLNCLHDIKNNI